MSKNDDQKPDVAPCRAPTDGSAPFRAICHNYGCEGAGNGSGLFIDGNCQNCGCEFKPNARDHLRETELEKNDESI